MIQGTILENIDPFGHKSEKEVINVLKEVSLWKHIEKMKEGLNTIVSESNNLFSVGQK